MDRLDDVRAAIDTIRPDIEGRYPLTLGAIEPEHIRGDDGYAVDYVIHADRVGPMSFLNVCGLEIFIKERTGLNVLVHTHPIAETARAAAE